MSAVLSIRDLGAGYGEVDVINDVSIEVPEGSVVSVIGPNGAGKSTLLKAVYGLLRPRRGRVLLGTEDTKDITGWRPDRVTAAGMNYVPQLDNVFANLSVMENLELGAFTDRSRLPAGLERVFAWFPLLAERRRSRAGTLSGGQRQMLALARALMSDPTVLLLDEPSAGLAPRVVDEVFERIQAINAAGVAIVMVEQNVNRSLQISDYGYVLDMGTNRYEGEASRLANDETIAELYLGGRGRLATEDPS